MSIDRIAFWIANRRTERSFAVNAPSLKAGWVNRLVVAIPTNRPVCSRASPNALTSRSRSAADAPKGTRSLSCRLTPAAPISASRCTVSTGSSGSRVGNPNGSPPWWPTVHRPNVNLWCGRGSYALMGRASWQAVDGRAIHNRFGHHLRRVTRTIPQLFDDAAASVPDRIWLRHEQWTYTYAESRAR